MTSKQWHTIDVKNIINQFDSDISSGLTDDKVKKKTEQFGLNEIDEKKKRNVLHMILDQFKDFMVAILIIAAFISFMLGERADAIIIFIIVVINAILGITQESKAEKSLEALRKLSSPTATVLRNGVMNIIPVKELVPGDIIYLEAGNYIPADARIIESVNLKVEESALTGESVPVEKISHVIEQKDIPLGDRNNMVFSGSIVTYGRGSAIVVGTGMNTEVGQIANMISKAEETQTPLQQKLSQVGKILGIGAIAICGLIFIMGVWQGRSIFDMFFISVSLAVAAIPEGLPAIVTIVLAIGVQRLVRKHAIIRKLPAVETLGSASVICSDKTGTLTQNKMTVVKLYSCPKVWTLDANTSSKDKSIINVILEMGSLCNDSKLEKIDEKWDAIGDPTETALVIAAADAGRIKNELEQKMPRVSEIPFDSDRKLMTTIHKVADEEYLVITKGAPDVILGRCKKMLNDGKIIDIDEIMEEHIREANNNMADKALRVLGIAYKDLEILPDEINPDTVENNLIFIGLIGMIDPPREEAKHAVALCKDAGIKPVMITGDHKITATAIARDLGILNDSSEALTGIEFDKLDKQYFKENVDKYSVYARVSPEHKVKIVNAWKEKGCIVSMTGDGVNDAPALKSADIGCAMGITGTDVAKGAADMVLTDDNFATIVEAVREGRGIFDNIRKSIQFLLSCNIGEIITLFIAMLLNLDTPLLPIHILWVNLITDSFPALALGVEPVDKAIMKRKPRDPNKSIFAGGVGIEIGIQGAIIGILSLAAFKIGIQYGIDVARTMTFAVLSFSQLIHAFNMRSNSSLFKVGLFSNKYMLGAFGVSTLLQLLVFFIPLLREIFKITLLNSNQWFTIVLLSITPLILVEIKKLIIRK